MDEKQHEKSESIVAEDFAEYGKKTDEVMEFVSSCNSFSELVDKLTIENIRLWHILDDTIILKKELETIGIDKEHRIEILEKIAKKSFENVETVKRRSIFKKAIDELFIINTKSIIQGIDSHVCNENKSYGREK
ncbi:MAG: hypothetical protein K5793_07735 [Nitrosarchaeum sp.]|nr:hypothetical protein [Nitrosarchaeum sp.]